jgi:hypothetical protein
MSQITKTSLTFAFLLLLSVVTLAGCGNSNSQSNFDSSTGKHPSGWLPDGHMTVAKASLETCTQCHGADYSGGISKIACTDCHIGNQQSIHPTSWGPFGFILHADYVNTNTNSTCANALCHGAQLNGVGGTGPSCTSCHMGGVASMHPLWGTPAYATHGSFVKNNSNDTSGCANAKCHGTNLDGAGGAGPSCTSCHMGGVASVHPAEWNGNKVGLHKTRAGYTNYDSCRNIVCHGAALEGVYLSGHSCYACHNTLP